VQPVTLAEVRNLPQECAERDAKEAEDLKEFIAKAAEERHLTESKLRVETVLHSITAAGYESLYGFIGELLNTRDQQLSACVSRMLGCHGDDILNSIRACQPDLVKQWTLKVSGEILAQEGQKLANYLCPAIDAQVSEILQSFLLERIMSDANTLAPMLCELLCHVTTPQDLERTLHSLTHFHGLQMELVLPLFYSVGSKIDKITRIFDEVEYIKNRWVTYWAEKNGGPIVIRIISG
jgi:hypothetical protein